MFDKIKWKRVIVFALLFALVFVSTITSSLLLQSQSAYAVTDKDWDRFLQNKNFIEAVNEVEKHWKRDYDQYFGESLPSLSLMAEDIAQSLSNLAQQTDTKPAVVWIWPREKQLQLVIITPGQKPQIYSVKTADQETLLAVVKQLNVAVTSPSRRRTKAYLEPSQRLYTWMVKPLEYTLKKEKIDTILFCLGQGLRTLPIAALHDGNNFLVEKYSLARIPAFNLMKPGQIKKRSLQVLAMGASEFSQLESLPAVPVELSQITQDFAPNQRFINQEFTLKNFQAQRKNQNFEIIHLATHAEFNKGTPDQSYIQFWGNERISLDDIEKLQLDKPQVDLLVLSACRTALGDNEAELGFAGLTVKSGVKSVLASLWNVSDIGTLGLMNEFYQNLQNIPLKAKALQSAQIAMLKGEVGLKSGKLQGSNSSLQLPSELAELRDENFSHPYYWSAFTIIGNPW
ncbi:CHAT domain-containing protein [Okeanomitos corallinicola TIOX110]|uniref:CHAT domain-containing protein n=1 Tax=Okeanomitos corallinicola TIOX110 TaxID=3133117 RepID=A0ABZ2V2N6_9CYAN